MKKKILIAALIVCLLAVAAYGTLAYFTSEDTTENIIKSGNLKVKLIETEIDDNGEEIPYVNEKIGIMPGTTISKIVKAENVGRHDAYVRIRLTNVITLADGTEDNDENGYVKYSIDEENWTYADGWYYYNTALEAGKTSEALLSEVIFSIETDNLYQDSVLSINVELQAVQVQNNGADVFEAAGWPAV